MVVARLGWCIVAVCSVSSVAHARGSGSTGSEDSGGSTGGDSATSSDSASGDEFPEPPESGGDESCGDSCDGEGGVVFEAPTSTNVASPFDVTFTPLTGCTCDTCGCYPETASFVILYLDDEQVGECNGAGACTVRVSAPTGEHELRGVAEYAFHGVPTTMTINVTSSAQPGGTGGGTAGDTAGDTADDTEAEAPGARHGSGGGCTTAPDRSAAWLLAPLILGLRLRRTRRSS